MHKHNIDEIESALGEKYMVAVGHRIETAKPSAADENLRRLREMQRTLTYMKVVFGVLLAFLFFIFGFSAGQDCGRDSIVKALHAFGYDAVEKYNCATRSNELTFEKREEAVRAAPCPHEK